MILTSLVFERQQYFFSKPLGWSLGCLALEYLFAINQNKEKQMDLNYGAEYEDFRKDVQAFCKEYQGVSFKVIATLLQIL